MSELQWHPRDIGDLTIAQVVCLMHEKPPGHQRIDSAEDYRAIAAAEAEAEREWSHVPIS